MAIVSMPKQEMADGQDLAGQMREIARAAKAAAATLALTSTNAKNGALLAMAAMLRNFDAQILVANAIDIEAARQAGRAGSFIDRLTLTPARVEAMALGLEEIAELPDPVGDVIAAWMRPNGLTIERVRVPLGVIGMIYESRPNVTADAGGLCLKAGQCGDPARRLGWAEFQPRDPRGAGCWLASGGPRRGGDPDRR